MYRLRNVLSPEHTLTPNPFLPDGDTGAGDGGTGGSGAGGDSGQQGGQTGGQQPPAGQQQQTGDGNSGTDWKAHARTWETRAKESTAELDKLRQENERLRQAQMSDAEKAVAAARAEGEKAGLAKAAQDLVTARLEGALAHLPDEQREALLEGVNPALFLGEDGLPNRDAISKWADRVAPKQATPPPGSGLPLGRRANPAQPTDMNALIRRAAGVR